ncbi:arginine--tRNA ligase [Candidatus Poribacteria bacterium]|nr:arginine--tRNA ligase [Candidatus Poribacteria bacterium]
MTPTLPPQDSVYRTPVREHLTRLFSASFAALGANPALGDVVLSQRPELGQFQCNGALPAAKALGRKPREIAEAVIAGLEHRDFFAETSIAGPGFINIRVGDEFLAGHIEAAALDPRAGIPKTAPALSVVIDYGGPNVAKPMHVGHLRASIIGDALVRLFRFIGHDVKGDIHMGDWGTQMGMLLFALSERRPDLPYFDPKFDGPYPKESPVSIEDLQALYPVISARCKEDDGALAASQKATVELQQGRPGYRALWRHFVNISIAEMKEDFGNLGVHFDLWFGESDYDDRIPGLIEQIKAGGHAFLDAGAWIIPVEELADKAPIPPVMLLKSDGGTNYATTDLATIQQRVTDYNADLILYVVDKRQSLHFEQVFRAARRSGIAGKAALEHLPFGTMNGPDGRPFKTREGGVMRLKDLIAMMTDEARKRMLEAGVAQEYPEAERVDIARKVGIAALKYADLMNVRTADYVFDIERFTKFEGRTGSYLLYAAVRIKSILRKAAARGLAPGRILAASYDAERALMLQLALLPDAFQAAVEQRMPHHLCAFAYDLGQEFSRFYSQCHILTEEAPSRQASWLALCQAVLAQLELLLGILGVETPERM